MPEALRKLVPIAVLLIFVGGLGAWFTWRLLQREDAGSTAAVRRPVPVEVAPITRGPIQDRRTFSGTLVGSAELVVAPRVAGRVERLHVDIGDTIEPGAVVVELDDDEFVQAVAEAVAEQEVAKARVAAARAALDAAESNHVRVAELRASQIASESQLDVADAERRARQAELRVAEAEVQRASAAMEAAKIRLGYAVVQASWAGGDALVVARRWVDVGATVSANSALLTVVDLTPVLAVLHVTEREFARLEAGQPAVVRTDAYADETFAGRVLRVAPVFAETSRQARVEIEVPNEDGRLKPGMFVRVDVVLSATADATIVPLAALIRRGDGDGIFVLSRSDAPQEGGGDALDGATSRGGENEPTTVHFVPVRRGIVDGERVQVTPIDGAAPAGLVVTLGQQLIQDGSRVRPIQPTPR